MESRRNKRNECADNVGVSFVEVKEEPKEEFYDSSGLLQTAGSKSNKRSSETVNKSITALSQKMAAAKQCKPRKSRGTQVDAQDIDMLHVKRTDLSNRDAENSAIPLNGAETIIPQCRFCLRRVSRENLKVILRNQCKKVFAAFQFRVFHHDAYPMACSNCLNMIDIFLDYKSAVLKAHNLLVDKRMYLENDGWDHPEIIQSFYQCKSAIEQHRIHIDAIYDEFMVNEDKRNAVRMKQNVKDESSDEVSNPNDKHGIQYFETNDPIENNQSGTMPKANEECGVGMVLESDVIEEKCLLQTEVDGSDDNEMHTNVILEIPANNTKHDEENKFSPETRSYSQYSDPVYSNSSGNNAVDHDYSLQEWPTKPEEPVELGNNSETSTPRKRKYNKTARQLNQVQKQVKVRIPTKPNNTNKPKKYRPPAFVQSKLCDLCGQSVRPETIEGHRNRHLGIKPYNCPIDGCDWSFFGRSNMCTHVRRVHPENGVQSHKCDVCGKLVRGMLGNLNDHKRLHTLEKKYFCTVCGKGFTLNRYLQQHSVIHTGLFPYECSYCGKKFKIKWSMKTHEKNVHKKNKQA